MSRVPFVEKTNEEKQKEHRKEIRHTERENLVTYLNMLSSQTGDFTLRYDISLCTEILQGKENRRVSDLQEAVLDLARENEELTKKCDLLELHLHQSSL
ncbi:hypothetical protein NEFER03_1370 [Nematocida sp. LUAm3]|nr:hypothetical protein NEFER03_1370 [Nematocida sp. LUAm3]KAI5174658.1 hypothetical protein NEFER02_0768 [Nematocida sp. LUAm2]KAI5177781.1 hypothetical protein NEFER01_0983 [Nematocida sp. LUAm1]